MSPGNIDKFQGPGKPQESEKSPIGSNESERHGETVGDSDPSQVRFNQLIEDIAQPEKNRSGWVRVSRSSLLVHTKQGDEMVPGISLSLDLNRVNETRVPEYKGMLELLLNDLHSVEHGTSKLSAALNKERIGRLIVRLHEGSTSSPSRVLADVILNESLRTTSKGSHVHSVEVPQNETGTATTPAWKLPEHERRGPGKKFDEDLLALEPQLYGVAMTLTRNADEAHDLVQETFEKAHKARHQFEQGTNMKAWTMLILRNSFLSIKRHEQVKARTRPEVTWLVENAARLTNQESAIRLQETLEHIQLLPPEQRDAILLASEGHSYEEMARRLRTEVGTVKSRVSRARATLRRIANPDDEET